jgi:glycosyltransferase involved in cell wall biosynthesis
MTASSDLQSNALPLEVLMTSTSYPKNFDDWRGLFIRHLADALARRDDLRLSLWAPPGEVHERLARVSTAEEDVWLARLMQAGGIAHLIRTNKTRALFEIGNLLRHLRRLFLRQRATIYHINWLQNALPLPHNRRPVLITVLGTDMQLLKLPLMRSLVRRSLRGRKAAICPNAEWMVDQLQTSFGDLAIVRPILFGIDPRWYALQRRFQDEPIAHWLVVSRVTRAKIGPLFERCSPLFASGSRKLHLFGPMQEELEIPAWVEYHGPVSPDHLREFWFPRAQGLITLSRHAEGRPQVMLEAMASGIPIIASRMPAHVNMLEHGRTGLLVETSQELATGIALLENVQENVRIGSTARDAVIQDVGTWDDCAQRYATMYRSLSDA